MVTPTPLVANGSSVSAGEPPLAARPISTIAPPSGAFPGPTEVVEDSRDDIISDAHRVFSKWKAILAIGEVYTGALKIGKRVQSRRNFTHLLNSISSTPEVIVVIPDDDVE